MILIVISKLTSWPLKVPSQKSFYPARNFYVKEMGLAGLKIDLWKFWKGQKLGLDDSHHVFKNLSKIPTLRSPNRILRGSIPPSLAHCNASFPRSCASLPMPRVLWRVLLQLLQLLDVSRRDRGKLCGAALKTRENVEKKRYNARDRAGYSATLDAVGLAALNPRVSGNGALS